MLVRVLRLVGAMVVLRGVVLTLVQTLRLVGTLGVQGMFAALVQTLHLVTVLGAVRTL